jgi:hypothetical protein
LNLIRQVASGAWSAIRSTASSAWHGISSVVSSVVGTIRSVLSGVKGAASTVFNGVRDVASRALNAILTPIRSVASAFGSITNAIQNVISWIGRIKFPSPPSWLKKIPGVGSLFKSAVPSVATPSAFGTVVPAGGRSPSLGRAAGPVRTAGTLGGPVVVNVYGGLDSADTIARRVSSALRGRERRTSGVQLGRVAVA